MDTTMKFKIVIDFYTTILCLGWLKRRIYSKWEMEKELLLSDFL